MHSSFLSDQELAEVGFAAYGRELRVSRRASIYAPEKIRLGDHVRIDDFCILSGGSGIEIGDHVHIAAYSSLYGQGKIVLHDFVNISSRVAIYSISDDFSGKTLTNPTIPSEYLTNQTIAPVVLHRHVLIGTASTVLPGVEIGEGGATGAYCLVNRSLPGWMLYVGVPARPLRERERGLLQQEAALKLSQGAP